MKPYGRKPQHPKGWAPGCRLPRGARWWWEAEGAQPEKGRARAEARDTIESERVEIDQEEAA